MSNKNQYTYKKFLECIQNMRDNDTLLRELELLEKSVRSYQKRYENGEEESEDGFENTPLYAYFGVDHRKFHEASVIRLKELESTIQPLLPSFSEETFTKLWNIFLPDMYHNFQIIIMSIEEVIIRKDSALQTLFVQQFLKARKYYDSGHRSWEKTIQDQMIDTYFEKFEIEPLHLLLSKVSMDSFPKEGGDGMERLFIPVFESIRNTPPEMQKKWEKLFSQYINYLKQNAEPASVIDSITTIFSYTDGSYRSILQQERDALIALDSLLQEVRKHDPKTTTDIIYKLGEAISFYEYTQLRPHIIHSIETDSYSIDTLRHLLEFSIQNDIQNELDSLRDEYILHALFRADTHRAQEVIHEIHSQHADQLPKDYWDASIYTIGKQLLEPVDFDFDNPEYKKVISFSTRISQKKAGVFEKEIILNYIIDILPSITRRNSALHTQFLRFIEKNSAKLHHLGAFWETFDTTLPYEILGENLSYFHLGDDDMNLFYENYFEVCMNSGTWKPFDVLISHLEKNEAGKYILRPALSNAYATYVAETISYDDVTAVESFKRIETLEFQPLDFERILAQLLGWSINQSKRSMTEKIVSLIPNTIQWDTLAYNLCCYYAKKKDKPHLLIALHRAIELGKSKNQFLDDPDFDEYREDSDFLQAIKAKK